MHTYRENKTVGIPTIYRMRLFVLFYIMSNVFIQPSFGSDPYTRIIKQYTYDFKTNTVIGALLTYTVVKEDTFLDIARKHQLGLNEMTSLYPQTDPWMPPLGKEISIPACWILPPRKNGQLVINIPEMRLYLFEKTSCLVQTYPVSIGSEGWETPEGNFSITEKRANPKWYIPKSLQEKYGMKIMQPGPDNPLGEYVMRFSDTSYSLHGTHMPWGVGRLISHGCIRCYPEHIRLIYPQVPLGTKVEIIYEPIKFGLKAERIFVEIHPDVYHKISDFNQYAEYKLRNYHLSDHVDGSLYRKAVLLQNGLPVDVTLSRKNEAGNISEKDLSLLQ